MFKKHPVLCSIAAAAVAVIIFQLFWGIAVVSGNSMSPSYEDGDLVLFNKRENPEKNQAVVAYVGDKYVIKRIVAVQGDVITICDNILLINGEEQGSVDTDGDDAVMCSCHYKQREYSSQDQRYQPAYICIQKGYACCDPVCNDITDRSEDSQSHGACNESCYQRLCKEFHWLWRNSISYWLNK